MKPVIVVTPQTYEIPNMPFEAKMYATMTNCADIFTQRGCIPVVPAFLDEESADQLVKNSDGVFLTGGADVNPALYGEEKQSYCGDIEPDRDRSDLNLLKAAIKYKKPVIAVCRGSQMATVHFGGALYQDLKTQTGTKLNHTDLYRTKGELSHEVQVIPGTPLYNLFKEDVFSVNSTHHQGFKKLGPDCRPMAYATDGLCESWYCEKDGIWVRVYQWHPEMQDDNKHKNGILNEFVEECKARMNK